MTISLNKEQQSALEVFNSGHNVFLTGRAGTGKSFLLEYFIGEARKSGKRVVVTAFTGIAAQNINGATLNSTFALQPIPQLRLPQDEDIPLLLRNTDIFIIDEISICRIDMFEYVMNTINLACKKWNRSIQVIVVGDFFQLPPVITAEELDDLKAYYHGNIGKGFAFQSRIWTRMGFKFIELKHVMRQDDVEFVQALDKIRRGDPRGRTWIKSHSSPRAFKDACSIVPTRKEAAEINRSMLEKLDKQTECRYIMDIHGSVSDDDIRADKELVLRDGALVMILVNDTSGRGDYVNGTYGTIVGLYDDCVDIQLQDGQVVRLDSYKWLSYGYTQSAIDPEIYEPSGNEYHYEAHIIGWHSQIPVKLAWAITIHKSQGQTYERINMDISRSWESGHVYTALSRIRNSHEMYIHGIINAGNVTADPEVLAFYDDPSGYKTKIKGPYNCIY